MKKKKPALKKATTKKPAAKGAAVGTKARPSVSRPAPKKDAPSPASAVSEAPRRATYTPPPVQGIGWAPFRYPPQ
jgi:hypothetical protein